LSFFPADVMSYTRTHILKKYPVMLVDPFTVDEMAILSVDHSCM
jgi:hypothetical protein